jgi:hypothetical protein
LLSHQPSHFEPSRQLSRRRGLCRCLAKKRDEAFPRRLARSQTGCWAGCMILEGWTRTSQRERLIKFSASGLIQSFGSQTTRESIHYHIDLVVQPKRMGTIRFGCTTRLVRHARHAAFLAWCGPSNCLLALERSLA